MAYADTLEFKQYQARQKPVDWAAKIGWRKIYAYEALEDFDVTFTDYGPYPEFKEEQITIQAKKGERVYVGSAWANHDNDDKHRRARELYFEKDGFNCMIRVRCFLEQHGSLVEMVELDRHKCNQREIEIAERSVIRIIDPKLNQDKNPVQSSEKRGSY